MADENTGKVTLRMSTAAKEACQKIMLHLNLPTIQAAVQRALGDEKFLAEQSSDGWKVMLVKDGKYREVVWPEDKGTQPSTPPVITQPPQAPAP